MNQAVVLDADFLSSFLKIDRLHLVKEFSRADALLIPPAVYVEVRLTRFFSGLASLPSVRMTEPDPSMIEASVTSPGSRDRLRREGSDCPGEAGRRRALLMSDNQGRLWATRIGLHSVGIPVFLLACKQALLVDAKEIAAISCGILRRKTDTASGKMSFSFSCPEP